MFRMKFQIPETYASVEIILANFDSFICSEGSGVAHTILNQLSQYDNMRFQYVSYE